MQLCMTVGIDGVGSIPNPAEDVSGCGFVCGGWMGGGGWWLAQDHILETLSPDVDLCWAGGWVVVVGSILHPADVVSGCRFVSVSDRHNNKEKPGTHTTSGVM